MLKQSTGVRTYNLGHVENDNGGLETDTDTSNKTTSNDGSKRVAETSDHLNDNTNHVDTAAENNSPLAANHVGKITGNEGAKEGTAGENRDDQRLVAFAEGGGIRALDGVDEVERTVDSIDISGIVTEEDTAKGGKGAQEVGLPGDGSLDGLDILGSMKGDGLLSTDIGLVVDSGHVCGRGDTLSWRCKSMVF